MSYPSLHWGNKSLLCSGVCFQASGSVNHGDTCAYTHTEKTHMWKETDPLFESGLFLLIHLGSDLFNQLGAEWVVVGLLILCKQNCLLTLAECAATKSHLKQCVAVDSVFKFCKALKMWF